jgi:hypothetical protein
MYQLIETFCSVSQKVMDLSSEKKIIKSVSFCSLNLVPMIEFLISLPFVLTASLLVFPQCFFQGNLTGSLPQPLDRLFTPGSMAFGHMETVPLQDHPWQSVSC